MSVKREEVIFMAKRLIVDSIWKSANLEGLGTTFPKTEMILENLEVDTTKEEVFFIINMKKAWDFLLENVNYNGNCFAFIRELNKICGDNLFYGNVEVRTLPVQIGGTFWNPGMPDLSYIYDSLKKIESLEDPILKALTYFCYLARTQIFIDGNKRVAQLMANKVLIENCIGIFQIPINAINRFKTLLISFYESNDNRELIEFMKKYCIRFTDGYRNVYRENISCKDIDFVSKDIGEFVLSQQQCKILNSILYNLNRLLLAIDYSSKWSLSEMEDIFYLESTKGTFKYNYLKGTSESSGCCSSISDSKLREFVMKTILLLNKKLPIQVKRITFKVSENGVTLGIMRDSSEENGSIEFVLE